MYVDGQRFDSKGEARRYGELRVLEAQGRVADIQRQVRFPLAVNGVHVCTYVADFVYRDIEHGAPRVVEDTKGARTDVYKLKRALMLAVHGIEIHETAPPSASRKRTSSSRSAWTAAARRRA